jgi:hypothetical protein
MNGDARHEIAGDADVERAIPFARKDIDCGSYFAHALTASSSSAERAIGASTAGDPAQELPKARK